MPEGEETRREVALLKNDFEHLKKDIEDIKSNWKEISKENAEIKSEFSNNKFRIWFIWGGILALAFKSGMPIADIINLLVKK